MELIHEKVREQIKRLSIKPMPMRKTSSDFLDEMYQKLKKVRSQNVGDSELKSQFLRMQILLEKQRRKNVEGMVRKVK